MAKYANYIYNPMVFTSMNSLPLENEPGVFVYALLVHSKILLPTLHFRYSYSNYR